MSQHDYDLANQTGALFRADANDALAAIVSNNSGATEPTTTFAYQWWADTTTGILKQRNAANNAWVNILTLSSGAAKSLDGTISSATTAVTQTAGDNSTKVATTEYVDAAAGNAQIQPISASVGSSALTISASSLTLEFRDTTLGSGTVTKVTGTPANLVLSSGSTLGTTSGVQSELAVIAMNNAGTIELGVVNIAGGVDLSETGLISTTAEGGAGGADSATVVYSTTARTNLAYRVIGIIRSTQATAGTWATAPSFIQGAGGNALTSMMSLGHGQTWQNVSGSRAKGTTYYNTTGKPIFVSYTIQTSVLANNQIGLFVNGTAVVFSNGAGNTGYFVSVSGVVPPGASYKIDDLFSTSGSTSFYWFELR